MRVHYERKLKGLEKEYVANVAELRRLRSLEKDRALRVAAYNDLYTFATEVMGFRELYEPLHRPLCDLIADERCRRRLILLPRGHFKTTIISISYPLWCLVRDPNCRVALVSKAVGKAEENVEEIIHRARREEFLNLFGDILGSPDNWPICRRDKIRVPRKGSTTGPSIAAYSVESSEVGRHFDRMILDDPVDAENCGSILSRDNVWSWFGRQLSVLDPGSIMTVVGTRWHWDDLYSRIQKEMTRWDGANPISWWIERRSAIENGKLLFPGRFTKEILDEIKKVQGDYIYSCFYMNDPVGEGMNPFDLRSFKWVDYVPPEEIEYDEEPRRKLKRWTYLLVDPASTKKEYSSYSGIILGDALSDSTFVVRDAFLAKLHPDQLIDRIFELCSQHKVDHVVIEDEAYQKSLYYWLRRDQLLRGYRHHIEKIPNPRNVSQEMRLMALQPYVNNGACLFDKGMSDIGRRDLMEEFETYPRGPHKDLICALYFLTQIRYPPYEYAEEKKDPLPRHLQFINELVCRRRGAGRFSNLSVGGIR